MKEESWTVKHVKGITEEETWRRHLESSGAIWEASRAIKEEVEAYGSIWGYLESIWEACKGIWKHKGASGGI